MRVGLWLPGGSLGKVGSSELPWACSAVWTQVLITRAESVGGLPGAWGESGGSQDGWLFLCCTC